MRILTVIGTRPEAIKLAPVVIAMRSRPGLVPRVCLTGQHRELLAQGLQDFDIQVDHNLDIMKERQTLNAVAARVLETLPDVLAAERPDWVLVQGDTTTAMAGALAAFQFGARVAHVEAGLRTGDIHAPWPEEMNRRLIAQLTTVHFAPNERARDNLIREGIISAQIAVTGNTVVDALMTACRRLDGPQPPLGTAAPILEAVGEASPLLLVTLHRRENLEPRELAGVEAALKRIAETSLCKIVCPFHPNPCLADLTERLSKAHDNILVIPPLNYVPFVALMRRAAIILTDSGGIQEEAAVLGRPVLIMRKKTERPEVIETGTGELVGTDPDGIVSAVTRLFADPSRETASRTRVFGDGRAAERICDRLLTEDGDKG